MEGYGISWYPMRSNITINNKIVQQVNTKLFRKSGFTWKKKDRWYKKFHNKGIINDILKPNNIRKKKH